MVNYTYRSRFFSKSAYTLMVRLFAPALAFEMMGPSGLILSMAIHYLLTNMVSWCLHFNGTFSPWLRIRMAFIAMLVGGITLTCGAIFSQIILVVAASGIFGVYESLFWTSFHHVREKENGSTERDTARWNIFEKLIAALFLFAASLFSDYQAPEFCMALGLGFAIIGIFSTKNSQKHPDSNVKVAVLSSHKYIHLALPFLEGIVAVSWIFLVRLISLDGSLLDFQLIGSGAVALARVTCATSLLGAALHYFSNRYEWKIDLLKTILFQIPIVVALLFLLDNTYYLLFSILLMSILRSMMHGQTVHYFRKLLTSIGSAHDTRERMKFTGRVAGLFLIIPFYNSIEVLLSFYVVGIVTLLILLVRTSSISD
jgi:hypothetical protein